jgi:hypothetical protein
MILAVRWIRHQYVVSRDISPRYEAIKVHILVNDVHVFNVVQHPLCTAIAVIGIPQDQFGGRVTIRTVIRRIARRGRIMH